MFHTRWKEAGTTLRSTKCLSYINRNLSEENYPRSTPGFAICSGKTGRRPTRADEPGVGPKIGFDDAIETLRQERVAFSGFGVSVLRSGSLLTSPTAIQGKSAEIWIPLGMPA